MKFVRKLYLKHPNWGIENLMLHITIITGIVYILYIINPTILSYIVLERNMVFKAGQVWRLVTFIFFPPSTSLLYVLFGLYFYYFLGRTLENQWGKFYFTFYYGLCMLSTIIAALLVGGIYTGSYVNLSLFLAFAMLYPEHQVLLFFFIPIKVKWLGLIDAVLLLFNFIVGSVTAKVSIIAAMVGFFVFFGEDLVRLIKQEYIKLKYKIKNRNRGQ